ncbi:MAG: hypothetical protein S4CHLAM2_08510 [Chlamydiales bacterium]|nr:hypothetical protein [Chlamydiales bacterium]
MATACGTCIGTIESYLTPSNWTFSESKITKIALIALLFSAVALTACALITSYPAASSAFITTFSIASVASLAALCVALVKRCQRSSTATTSFRADTDTAPPQQQQRQRQRSAPPPARGATLGNVATGSAQLADGAQQFAKRSATLRQRTARAAGDGDS